ncbi:major facilitator superfamily domain-containing protein [Aspergillus undulatus]|uniref:major facilitator superfamily domain-containing protein n=1 Tax=Aspergillus undulatus TaxID=1810928 RepID=UPI003CCD8F75
MDTKGPQVHTTSGFELAGLAEPTSTVNRERPAAPNDHEPADPFASGTSTPLVQEVNDVEPFPDGGTRSWLVVLGSFLLLMASYGLMNSVGVLQSYLEQHQLEGHSSQEVGWISGIFVFTSLILGVFVGPLFDAYGPKELVTAGTGLYSLSVLLTAECTRYWHFVLCFGIMAGVGSALISNVAMASVPHWFEARAGMALGTAMAGAGLGGVVFPYIYRGAWETVGFKWGMRIVALVVFVLCGSASFLVKARLPKKGEFKAAFDIRCFKDARYTWMTAATFCLELVVFGLIGLLPSYVIAEGFSTSTSVNVLVVLNVMNCVGRLVAGRIADIYGRLNVLILLVTTAVFLVFAVLYPFSYSLVALYVFSATYGFVSGSFICLAPVCVRQISPAKEIGMRFGTFYGLVAFATLISIPVGGEMLEKVGGPVVVIWLGGVLAVATVLFVVARWACLDYHWNWATKI